MGSTWCSRNYMNFRMLKCLIKLIDKVIELWKIDKVRKFFPIYPYWQYEKKHVDSQYDKLILYLSKNGQYSVKIDGGIILDVMINYCIILHVHVQFIGVSNSDKKNGIEYMHTTDTLTRLDTTKQRIKRSNVIMKRVVRSQNPGLNEDLRRCNACNRIINSLSTMLQSCVSLELHKD